MEENFKYIKLKCEIIPNPNNTVSITSGEDEEKMLNDLVAPAEKGANRTRLLKHKVEELAYILRADIVDSDTQARTSKRLLDRSEIYSRYLEEREEHDQDIP